MKNEISNRDYLEATLNEMIAEMDTADAKLQDNMNTYIIIIPGCAGSYARHDFQSYEWESTDYLTQAWTVEAANEKQAVEKFHKAFNIALTDYFTAIPLLEAINTKLSFYRAF